MATILISGGTGLIGKRLCYLLKEKGHHVLILSRTNTEDSATFYWNVDENYVDKQAIIKADYIIHLAGAGIADKRWTKNRKKVLIESRVKSTNLLFTLVKEFNPNLKGFISASGIGYYGAISSSKIYSEEDESGNDFISTICKQWEKTVLQFNLLNIRTVIFRTGIVFSEKGGAFQKILKPIKLGFGSLLGTGNQYMPWIHIEDLCNMYIQAIENSEINGIYNAVSPEHITNKTLTKAIAEAMNKPLWLPNIPSFILKIALGKLAVIILKGSRISCEKIEKTGFKFKYPTLKYAIENLIK